jgi:hypothetical protein
MMETEKVSEMLDLCSELTLKCLSDKRDHKCASSVVQCMASDVYTLE